jgi:hypothetical protein
MRDKNSCIQADNRDWQSFCTPVELARNRQPPLCEKPIMAEFATSPHDGHNRRSHRLNTAIAAQLALSF